VPALVPSSLVYPDPDATPPAEAGPPAANRSSPACVVVIAGEVIPRFPELRTLLAADLSSGEAAKRPLYSTIWSCLPPPVVLETRVTLSAPPAALAA